MLNSRIPRRECVETLVRKDYFVISVKAAGSSNIFLRVIRMTRLNNHCFELASQESVTNRSSPLLRFQHKSFVLGSYGWHSNLAIVTN